MESVSDEDLVGQMIELAKGLHPSTMSAVLLTKWMLLVFDDMLLDPMWSPFDDM